MARFAIIDLGTNTFNLLVAEALSDNKFKTLYETKISVKLGEGGIGKGYIADAAFERGINAVIEYNTIIKKYAVEKVLALATSAVRGASNGMAFVEKIKQETGIEALVISGEREAELIYEGVCQAATMNDEKSLIMDIGGGSTEFVIANEKEIFWKYSFLLGAARLLEKFNPSDPITPGEISDLTNYLTTELQPLFEAAKKYPITELIGSSGSFDSLAEMVAVRYYSPDILSGKTEFEFHLEDVKAIHNAILKSTKQERLNMKGLIEMRVDMIVVSSILLDVVLNTLAIQKFRLSTYSLKEGVMKEVLLGRL